MEIVHFVHDLAAPISDMKRVEKGTSAGGQFAEQARAEAIVVLHAGDPVATPHVLTAAADQ